MSDSAIKSILLSKCFEYVEQRIETSRQAMRHAQEASNSEEKSSAGDKYETGRAMAQMERDKAAQQLEEALKLKATLAQIKTDRVHSKVGLGSLVFTNANRFYLSISVGKVSVDGSDYLFISPSSPIGQLLLNRKEKDQFTFNKELHTIGKIL